MASRRPLDYRRLRGLIRPVDALRLLGVPSRREPSGQWRGPCPMHVAHSGERRTLSCTYTVAYCHRCHWRGDALQMWAQARQLPVIEAAYDLCERLAIAPPYL